MSLAIALTSCVLHYSKVYAQLPAAVRIMPLGASITHGSGDWGPNYRYYLWTALTEQGYSIDFVGSQRAPWSGAYPFPNFDQDHEGHYGFRIDMLAANIGAWATAAQPDIVLVHAGTNDISQGESAESALSDLSNLVYALRAVNSNITVLVAQLIPCDPNAGAGVNYCNPANMTSLNAQIPAMAMALDTPASRVIAVDHATGFNITTDLADGLHPNANGDKKIASRWLAALQTLLSAPPNATATAKPPATPTPAPTRNPPFNPRWPIFFPLVARMVAERR
jgi:hypothetical protein